jgi:hypothetical protein
MCNFHLPALTYTSYQPLKTLFRDAFMFVLLKDSCEPVQFWTQRAMPSRSSAQFHGSEELSDRRMFVLQVPV